MSVTSLQGLWPRWKKILRKATFSLVTSVRLYISVCARNSAIPTGRIFVKYFEFLILFSNTVTDNSAKGTAHEDLLTPLVKSRHNWSLRLR